MSGARDVRVLGGGPAGAAAARLLASWGHVVRVITRPPQESRLAVSVPPSTGKLFDAVGVMDAVDRAGFVRSTGNTVWWGSAAARVEPFAEGARGWQVDLATLSDTLLASAEHAGARIERAIATPDFDDADAFVLDCTGRAGVVARANDLRVYDEGPRTVALTGEWRTGRAWVVPDDSHTIVESYGDGWMWSVPLGPRTRHVAAMIDPQRSELARGVPAADVYRAEIAKTREFTRLLGDATLHAGPWGFDASTYGARTYAGDGWLLVGDAGSFIDPLSSAGVKKALASGWLAAIVAHTCLLNPSMQASALAFYDAREREIARHYSSESRAFLSEAARGYREAFWVGRSDEAEHGAADAGAIRAALERLKAAPSIQLTRAPAARIEARPFISGHEITLGPHLVTPDDPAGTRHLHGIDLIALLELAGSHSQVPDLYEGYRRRVAEVSLHDFLLAVSTAMARGVVMSE